MRFLFCFAAAALMAAGRASAALAPLWIPAPDSGIEDVLALLEANPHLRLTAALDSLPKELRDRARALADAGRLEPALRPQGDPPLPLLYDPWVAEAEL